MPAHRLLPPHLARRLLFGAGVLAAFAASLAACSSAPTHQTFTVDADGVNRAANETFDAYFPQVLLAHPGDTITFRSLGNGEPHTVTFGTLVDRAVKAYDTLGANFEGTAPPDIVEADSAVPTFFALGNGNLVPAGADACFVDASAPPTDTPCPARAQPQLTGKQAYYNSGWLPAGARFTVHLSRSITPGTYYYMCTLHREAMAGRVMIVPTAEPVPSPAQQFAEGQKELGTIEDRLRPAVASLRNGSLPVAGVTVPTIARGASVLVGSGEPSVADARIDEFGPDLVHVDVGGSVTFYFLGEDSVAFGVSPRDRYILRRSPDGSTQIDEVALGPSGGPGEPAAGPPPSPSKSAPQFAIVASATWNGAGFLNSGVFVDSAPSSFIEGYRVTFTEPGVYRYTSTVHSGMQGTVQVG